MTLDDIIQVKCYDMNVIVTTDDKIISPYWGYDTDAEALYLINVTNCQQIHRFIQEAKEVYRGLTDV